MRFLNSSKFRDVQKGDCCLHIAGNPTLSDSELFDSLCSEKFPTSIRGQFALVFTRNKVVEIAAVDHLCSIPLFFSKQVLGSIFLEVIKASENNYPNPVIKDQIVLLGGQSCGESTTFGNIKRIQPGSLYSKGKVKEFYTPYLLPTKEDVNTEKLKTVFENVIREKIEARLGQHVLLLSAGRDSVTIAGIVKKLDLLHRVTMVHVYSDSQPRSEKIYVEQIAQEMKLEVNYQQQQFSGDFQGIDANKYKHFWIEDPFSAKKKGAHECVSQPASIWTGEIGDQLFGGPKNDILMRYLSQVHSPSFEVIADIWINQAMTFGRSSYLNLDPAVELFLKSQGTSAKFAYDEIKQFIVTKLESFQNLSYQDKILRLNFILKGPYRLWAYSQDEGNWWTPYSDYRIIEAAMELPTHLSIGKGGLAKIILYNLWRSSLSDTPWRISKHGFGIPAKQFIRTDA